MFFFQALINHLWFGKTLKEAIAAPVVFVDSQNSLKFEPNFDKVKHLVHLISKAKQHHVFGFIEYPLLFLLQNVIDGLKTLGHKRETAKFFYNVVNAIKMEDGCICAVSDARKQGEAAGY